MRKANYPYQKLTAAALVLLGLLPVIDQAADEDSVDFQYSHYQEGKRDIYSMFNHDNNFAATPNVLTKTPQNLNPIEVDSIHGSSRFSLTDRIKFSFNYLQDTWSGATPFGTAPAVAGKNAVRPILSADYSHVIGIAGASPYAESGQTAFIDNKFNFYQGNYNSDSERNIPGAKNNQLTHVLSYALPRNPPSRRH